MKICPYALASIHNFIELSDEPVFETLRDISDFVSDIEYADSFDELYDIEDKNYVHAARKEEQSLADLITCRYGCCGRYNECCARKEEDD